MVRFGIHTLLEELSADEISGTHTSTPRVRAILKAALLEYGHGQHDDARALVALLKSSEVLKTHLEQMTADYLGLDKFSSSFG